MSWAMIPSLAPTPIHGSLRGWCGTGAGAAREEEAAPAAAPTRLAAAGQAVFAAMPGLVGRAVLLDPSDTDTVVEVPAFLQYDPERFTQAMSLAAFQRIVER